MFYVIHFNTHSGFSKLVVCTPAKDNYVEAKNVNCDHKCTVFIVSQNWKVANLTFAFDILKYSRKRVHQSNSVSICLL